MWENLPVRWRYCAIAALVVSLLFYLLLGHNLTVAFLFLFGISFAVAVAVRWFGVDRQQVYETLRLPPRARQAIDSTWPGGSGHRPVQASAIRRPVPESFRFVGADLFQQAPPTGYQMSASPHQPSVTPMAARERPRLVQSVQSSPGPALSSTRFRSNLDFSLNADVRSPGFSERVMSYHLQQDSGSQDTPSAPRPQIGEFHNVRLTQDSTPVRRVNLAAQVGLPLIISTPMAHQPNFYNQCLPPEDKTVQSEPAPSVLDALKEISRKRISNDDTPAGMKRYKNDMINAANEFPAVIKETSSPVRMISKRTREVVETSPDQPTKVAKLTQHNEIEAALSSSRLYQKQKTESKKRRAAANADLPEPVHKAVRTEVPSPSKSIEVDSPMVESPQTRKQTIVEEPSTPQITVSSASKKKAQTPSALHQVYSQVRLEEKGKASKQLSNKELREKKLRGLMDALKDYVEPEPEIEEVKPKETAAASTPLASISSVTSVTTSIQAPVVSSTSPVVPKTTFSATSSQAPSTDATKNSAATVPSFNLNSSKPSLDAAATATSTAASTGFQLSTSASTGFQLSTSASTTSFGSLTTAVPPATTTSTPTLSGFQMTKPDVAATAPASAAATPSFSFGNKSITSVTTPATSAPAPTLNFPLMTSPLTPASTITTTAAAVAPPPPYGTPTTATGLSFGATSTPVSAAVPSALPTLPTPVGGFSFLPTTAAGPAPVASSLKFGTAAVSTTMTTPSGFASLTSGFGTPKATGFPASTTTTPSGFGALGSPATFGTPTATTAATSTSIFSASGATPAFGAMSTPATTAQPPAFGATFGAATTSSSIFGGVAAQSNTTFSPATAALPGFGAQAAAPTQFGATPTTTQSSSVFGAGFGAAQTTTTTASSGFGAAFGAASSTAAPFGSSFAPTTAATTGQFGFTATPATTSQQSLPSFGTLTNTASPFGAPTTAAPAFGAVASSTPAFGAAAMGSPAFGAPATTTATPAFNFGASAAPSGTSSFSFSSNTQAAASPFGGAAAGTSIFGAGAAASAPAAAASDKLFNFGGGPGAFGAPSTASAPVTGFQSGSGAFSSPQAAPTGTPSIFGGFTKKAEPASAASAFKFGGDKIDSSPAAAASLFGVPPTQNPFGGAPSAAAPFNFNAAGGAAAPNQQQQQAPPAYNFSAGSNAPFAFNANQAAPGAGGAFAFNAGPQQPPNPFQQQQQQHQLQQQQQQQQQQQPGGFNIGTSAPRRQTLQARRRR